MKFRPYYTMELVQKLMKKTSKYLIYSPLTEKVLTEWPCSTWQRVDVKSSTQEYCHKGSADIDWVEVVLGKGEHRDPDVGEDEVLRHEVEKVEEVFRGLFWFFGEVVVGIVSLGYSAE